MLRTAKVSSVDYAAGTMQVTYEDDDNSVSNDYPMMAGTYHMPAPGDMVQVLEDAAGAERGVVLGRAYSKQNPPPEGGAGIYRQELGDGIYLRQQGGTFLISANGKTCEIIADTLTITANTINITAASGEITVNGIPFTTHTHTAPNGETSGPQ